MLISKMRPTFCTAQISYTDSISAENKNVVCLVKTTALYVNARGGSKRNVRAGNGTWCIAKPSADETKLQDNIEYSCKQPRVDCRGIGSGGACFMPNNVVSHASVAMNLYYKAVGMHEWDCYFNGTALIVRDDPSIGKCRYT
ncbi:major pollen allergen Ole e 10-like isoform X1 [Magnolia sinica]|uniref:major pollen allergen Ole e 10-like isoform X1 n=1 Tax=Magnolia sinica TaxID=86752 RepID=UPI002658B1C8|nr:major pollen allergen Ole e 10-like isoform X1 [Magnolia sinica]